MGPWLLAMLNLTFALLCVALVFSLHARGVAKWKLRLLRLIPLGLVLSYAGLAGWAAFVHQATSVSFGLRQHLILGFLLSGYLLGMLLLRRRARKDQFNEETLEMVPAARSWHPAKLALAAIALLGLQSIAWWHWNGLAQQQLQMLKLEAETKALAVMPGRPVDEENAALLYEQAFAMLPEGEEWDPYRPQVGLSIPGEKPALAKPDPQLKEILRKQTATLALLQRAADFPACCFERREIVPRGNFDDPVPTQPRALAELLRLHASVVASEGDLQSALRDVQTMYRLADHVSSDPFLVSLLTSYALDEMTQRTLQQLLNGQQPTADELSPLEFNPVYSRTRLLTRSYRMEEAIGLEELSNFSSEKNDVYHTGIQGGITVTTVKGSGLSQILPLPLLKLYPIFLQEDDVATYRRYLQKYIQLASRPYPQATQEAEMLRTQIHQDKHGLRAKIVMANLSSPVRASARAAALHSTAETAVAVHRFRAGEGKLPQTLQELVPKYLTAVPLDPFDEQPLRWKITGDDWVVYSIGENLQDDGGITAEPDPREGDICFFSRLPEAEHAPEEADSQ